MMDTAKFIVTELLIAVAVFGLIWLAAALAAMMF